MSTVFHRRELHVAITAAEAGKEFADAPADVQAAFLSSLLDAIDDWDSSCSWAMQCRNIIDEISPDYGRRMRLAMLLDTLSEHLKEPVAEAVQAARQELEANAT